MLLFTAVAGAYPAAPNPELTPGQLCERHNPHFKEFRYKERIPYCRRAVSPQTKSRIYELYGISAAKRVNYTIDHLIPLSAGGDNSPENLWPEHMDVKRLRYNLEVRVYNQLRRGEITQDQALQIIVEAKMNPPLEVSAFEGVLYEGYSAATPSAL